MTSRSTNPNAGLQGRAANIWRSVPRRLTALTAASVVLSIVSLLALNIAYEGARGGINDIGRDGVPSVISSQRIAAFFWNIDASTSNDVLAGGLGSESARADIAADSERLRNHKFEAIRNVTIPGEEELLKTIDQAWDQYVRRSTQAQSETRHGLPVGATYNKRADEIIGTQAAEAAQELDRLNYEHVNAQLAERKVSSTVQLVVLGVLFGSLSVVLVYTQVFVRRSFRRKYNAYLAGATVLTVGLMLFGSVGLWNSHNKLENAYQEAFGSEHALVQLLATANAANADESLWLIANGGGKWATTFTERTTKLLDPAVTAQLLSVGGNETDSAKRRAAIDVAARVLAVQAADGQVRLNGLIGDTLANVSYPGEKEAAIDMLVWYVRYMQIDGELRALENQGRHADAVVVATGTGEGQSKWAFNGFAQATERAIGINQQAFEERINDASRSISYLNLIGAVAMLLVAGLTVAGLWPRINEYR